MHARRTLAALFCGAAFAIGCGDGSGSKPAVNVETAAKPSSKDELKKRLEEISVNGEGGSAAVGLRPFLEDLRQTDAGTADQLLKDLNQLESATNPDRARAIAKRMVGVLK